MANEKLAHEILSIKELDNVTGGTSKEFMQILSTVVSNKYLMNEFKDVLGDVTGGNLNLENTKDALKRVFGKLGIDATISLYDDKNVYKYKKDGKSILHTDVINIIKNYT